MRLLAADLGADVHTQALRDVRGLHVVVGAGGQAVQHRVLLAGHDQRDLADLRHLADLPARLRDTREVEAEHDAVGGLLAEKLERVADTGAGDDVVRLGAQRVGPVLEDLADRADDEHLARPVQAPDRLDRQLLGGLPQHRGQLRQDHRQVLLLADERVGAGVQHLHLGRVVVGGGHQQARGVAQRRVEADPADHRGAVDARHHAVHDHRVRPAVGRHPQALLAARRGDHGVPLRLQQLPQLLAERQAVVDHQDGGGAVTRAGRVLVAEQLAGAGDDVTGVVRLADVLVRAGPQPG